MKLVSRYHWRKFSAKKNPSASTRLFIPFRDKQAEEDSVADTAVAVLLSRLVVWRWLRLRCLWHNVHVEDIHGGDCIPRRPSDIPRKAGELLSESPPSPDSKQDVPYKEGGDGHEERQQLRQEPLLIHPAKMIRNPQGFVIRRRRGYAVFALESSRGICRILTDIARSLCGTEEIRSERTLG
ncbi:hypothetical protein BV898_04433 [Hypsibius exemplaris]|uniref:Uncharacterized protein n=1 Tax=Hypsibius exemplaris TaxID=2072580 RepID=A0A1W0X287_HYPEX|nr:hypothetical protein BV898_04433 [Hypsibius exemplaris]